jgi:4-hydroxy-tetrahydrodipicolinate synthase
MVPFEGVFSVLATPFTPRDAIDTESLTRIVDLCLAAGVNGVTALGVTSEVARLSESERWRVLETVARQVNRRAVVVAGTTAEGTTLCIEHSKRARDLGADAVMVSPPRMPKPSADSVVRHYAALAGSVDLPIVVQDYPPVSGFSMEPALLARIAREVPVARTIKLEDPPTPLKTSRILEMTADIEVRILGGLGGVFLLEELLAGAAGAMTGFAYPEILVDIVARFRRGDVDQAAEVFYRFVPLMRFEFQEGIGMAIRKEVLRRRGAIVDATVRQPAGGLDATTRAALDRVLAWARKQGGTWISG